MSMISAVRDYIETYNGVESDEIVYVNFVDDEPVSYSIIPVPGSRIINTDIIGNTTREYPFVFRTSMSTADNLERLENAAFFENFAEWLDTQSEAGTLPSLASGQTARKIEATNWGYLYEEGQSDTGIYQINCMLTYRQDA
jgi:hypothetical protein